MVSEGQLYTDSMFKSELRVTAIDENGTVYLKDTRVDGGNERGNPYPREMFDASVAAKRFRRVDQFLEPDKADERTNDTTPETPDDDESDDESSDEQPAMTDEFDSETTSPLNW